ncbi:MAG: hypothetical protein OEU68_06810 [Nitrospira sp.]|nr:hypothetical protein [Nitrospira sp.]MDH4243224.1 hypothetical protein [Nitrospira sp.]MDH4356027.1 hypothetical protein [Nitrospira sp.]MDH5317430.1 hypothetical protein [Nitrospira sp.]
MSDTGPSSLTWDEFCGLLDGSWRDRSRSNAMVSDRCFFEADPEKRLLEVWCLKVSGMHALCSNLADEHERIHSARGMIDPEQVIVQFPERRTSMLPMYWNATVSLVARESEHHVVFENMPAEMASSLTMLPASMNLAYVSPRVRDWPMGKMISVTALVQSIDPIPEDDPGHMRGLIRVHVIADGLQAEEFSDHDVFRLSLPIGEQRGRCMDLWARKIESPERGIIVTGRTDCLSLEEWKLVTGAVGTVRSSVEAAVYRAVSPADDVYSCGMLLLRALLGSDEQCWTRACEYLPSIVQGLEPVVQGLEEDDHYARYVRVKDRVSESTHCFKAEAQIPEAIWWDAVVAVLRACSTIQGFSYASEAATYDPSPARGLARELEVLARRARTELFEADQRDAMILRVCEHAMNRRAVCVS